MTERAVAEMRLSYRALPGDPPRGKVGGVLMASGLTVLLEEPNAVVSGTLPLASVPVLLDDPFVRERCLTLVLKTADAGDLPLVQVATFVAFELAVAEALRLNQAFHLGYAY